MKARHFVKANRTLRDGRESCAKSKPQEKLKPCCPECGGEGYVWTHYPACPGDECVEHGCPRQEQCPCSFEEKTP